MKIVQRDWFRFCFEGKWGLVDLTNEWAQFFTPTRWNWITFHFINFQLEKEEYLDTAFELEFYVLGFGIRIAWSADYWFNAKERRKKYDKLMKDIDKEIKEVMNDKSVVHK